MQGQFRQRPTSAAFHAQEIDPDEIFRMFFGGNPFMSTSFHTHSMPRQRQARQAPARNDQSLYRLLISFAPMAMLILFNILSQSKPPAYSLNKTRDYPFSASTAAHRVPFYIASKSKFMQQYRPGSSERARLEYQVESDWKELMQKQCYNERLMKHRYEYYGQPDKAARVSLQSCQALTEKFGSSESPLHA